MFLNSIHISLGNLKYFLRKSTLKGVLYKKKTNYCTAPLIIV